MMGELLRTMLRACGCHVIGSATNGEDAVRAYHRHRPDMVFLDIKMPGKDGLEALREIVGNDPDAFAVIITAESTLGHVKMAHALGAQAFLVKPVSASKLEAVVERFQRLTTERSLAPTPRR